MHVLLRRASFVIRAKDIPRICPALRMMWALDAIGSAADDMEWNW